MQASISPRCAALNNQSQAQPLRCLPKAKYASIASTRSRLSGAGKCRAVNPHHNKNLVNAAAIVEAVARPALESLVTGPATPSQPGHFQHDILGLGQAMVDYSASIADESLLHQFQVPKGGRRVVTVEERALVMETLDDCGCSSQLSPGGSLANTLVAVSRLARTSGKPLKVAMAGSMGVDTLGCYFNAQMDYSGVNVLIDEQAAHTGTVMVLTTPDAQRSFLSFFTSGAMQLTDAVKAAIKSTRVLVIEGYLWETPNALEYIRAAAALARESGAQVVLTAGDPGVVARHKDEILAVIADGVDMIFTNTDEALGLLTPPASLASDAPSSPSSSQSEASAAQKYKNAQQAALQLGTMCSVAIVTDGANGAYITALGDLHVIPPHWAPQGPVDTCGAGDAFAAGVLFAVLSGYDFRTAGDFAARVASAVISRFGPHLSVDDADCVVGHLPSHDGTLSSAGSLASLRASRDSWDML